MVDETFLFTPSQAHLLDWLSKEDGSSYGEAKGKDLDFLIENKLAYISIRDKRGDDYNRVALTEKGLSFVSRNRTW